LLEILFFNLIVLLVYLKFESRL